MKTILHQITTKAAQLDPQYFRMTLLVLTVSLLVLGAGAPASGGGGLGG